MIFSSPPFIDAAEMPLFYFFIDDFFAFR